MVPWKLPCSLDLISFKYAYLVIDDFHSNGETIVAEDVYSVPCAQNMKFGGNILAKINYKNDANYNVTNRISPHHVVIMVILIFQNYASHSSMSLVI